MMSRRRVKCLLVLVAVTNAGRLRGAVVRVVAPPVRSVQQQGPGSASQASPELPRFDIVSIKPNVDPDAPFYLRFTADGFSTRSVSIKTLIKVAFGLKDDRLLVDLPHEKETYYDVEAKVASGEVARFTQMSDLQKQSMLQSVLAERFHFKYHMTTKELPVYALVVGKSGPKLADAKPQADGKFEKTMQVTGHYTIVATGWTTGDFFQLLYEMSGRYVVDRTGLTGHYDFTLRCARSPGGEEKLDETADGPVIFTALREQLGLELKPSTAMLDAVVIDHVETPTPD